MTTRALGWLILGVVALTAILYLGDIIGPGADLVSQPAPEAAPEPAPAQASVASDAPAGTPALSDDAPEAMTEAPALPDAAQPVAEAAPDAPSASDPGPEAAPAPAPAPAAPRFDLVRTDPGGQTLVAGSAAPGAEISVLLDGELQPAASVDRSGRFALFLDVPPSASPRVLRLRMTMDGQEVDSDDEVILAPPAAAETAQALAEPATDAPATSAEAPTALASLDDAAAPDIAPQTTGTTPQSAEPAAAATEPPDDTADTPQTPAVLLSTAEGVEVMQPAAPAMPDQVAIDAITYGDSGEVTLSGRGTASSELRIYLDNRPVARADVPGTGRWQAELPAIETGTYTLRVDEIDAQGTVASRAESPFLREDPAKLAAAGEAVDAGAPLRVVTVQPGHTLWALARDRYGEGTAYVKLFEANRGQIRNPDLIYPGQVFDMPD
ncbi:LysM peptidoglycan-binding domain-containing protein [uncultured Salipiger sp.]|uniref:LysM peptidoglycan-binding domain-containing protein n=1 Tax=uncultured Salipiger sp. TaxID=499810 RepID=UPI0025926E40|nr:LysM peptidoglycan-binding domain-containing protein [uncultured Salipiger sp.]